MQGIVICDLLNVRSERRKDVRTNILGTIEKGTIVEITNEYKTWLEIKYNDVKAYVVKEYIQIDR